MTAGVPAERGWPGTRSPRSGAIDALLVLMVLIWGTNYSVIKRAFAQIPPQPFNAVRLTIAALLFFGAIQAAKRRRASGRHVSAIFYTPDRLTVRDRLDLLWLGVVGHFVYQACFVAGIAQTSVANGALIIGATPAVVTIVSAVLGRERITRLHWAGAAISILGIYFVVGRGASFGFGGATLRGDVLMMISVFCWVAYTIGSSRLMARHSPLYVTGMTMIIGGAPYAIVMLPQVVAADWADADTFVWAAVVLSALLALCVAYLIWYTAVQQIGPARTAIYSNVVPIVAMAVAAIWLGEPISRTKLIGAAAVLSGIFLTRLGRQPAAVPMEE